ncbi:MAG TPA: TonB-dependent receptor [Burkholderiaceae bacterium]|jgi:vitamin B12 transporter|nr:TonB-dependent receptor [Burkholderiaceae bacterium]
MKHRSITLRPAAAAVVCALASSTAFAADEGVDTRTVVITGNLKPRTLGNEIAASSVLTRADLERTGVRDLVSALNLLGASQVEQLGGSGTIASVRLRGADTRDTLVLVDGVPLTDVTTGASSISQISVDSIERIEVVRGNLSALYGANATGGVIQVFTRRGVNGLDAQVHAGLGSQRTRAGGASVAGGSEALRGRLTVDAERTDGFSAANPAIAPTANPDRDGNRRRSASLALDSQIATGHQIGADLRVLSGRVSYDGTSSFDAPTDTHESHTVQRGAALRGKHALTSDWSLAWRTARADESRNDDVNTAFGGFSFGNTLHNRESALDLSGTLAHGWNLLAGVEALHQSTDNLTYTRRDRDTDTLRAGISRDASWGSMQFNLRHDHTSDFGNATTALLGANVKLDKSFSLIGSVSSSFTPPTLDFLFFDCSPFGFACSNPDLKPERSHDASVGLQWDDGASTLVRATFFAARYRDKIANDVNFVPQNIARARNNGLELAAHTRVGQWHVSGEAVWQNPVDADSGQRLTRRARHQIAGRVEYDAGAWGATVAVRALGDRPDGARELGGYGVVDLSARWTLSPQWALQARAENVFDHAYEPAAGYNGRPRAIFVGVNWQLPR